MQGTPTIAVLIGCLIAFPLTDATGSAQEPPDTVLDVEEVEVVVGSRAGVADPATLPVPVDIYGAEEIARLGEVDLAEVLGGIAPSFNSTRLSAGDGAALHVATLRGMNGDQVLVLVNGKRRHGVAFAKVLAVSGQGTTGTDLRAIPVHAIKRIEVLREGAASQYGSDAVAGVINIVLKDDAGGISAATFLGRTSRGDGDEADHISQRRCVPRGRIPQCHRGGGEAGGDEPGGCCAHLLRSRPVLRPLRGWRQGHPAAAQRRARLQGRGLHGQCGNSPR